MATHRTRTIALVTLACAAALTACGTDTAPQEQSLTDAPTSSPTTSPEHTPTTDSLQPSEVAPAASTTAATTASTAASTTASFDAAPAPLVARNPADFTEADPSDPFAAYALTLSPGNMCMYYAGGGYFSCTLALRGQLPPLDPDYGAPAGQNPDVVMWGDDRGFVVTHTTGGGEGMPEPAQLYPGQMVTAGDYTFEHRADGTVRVSRSEHWFEVSPQGQYASDRFTP